MRNPVLLGLVINSEQVQGLDKRSSGFCWGCLLTVKLGLAFDYRNPVFYSYEFFSIFIVFIAYCYIFSGPYGFADQPVAVRAREAAA